MTGYYLLLSFAAGAVVFLMFHLNTQYRQNLAAKNNSIDELRKKLKDLIEASTVQDAICKQLGDTVRQSTELSRRLERELETSQSDNKRLKSTITDLREKVNLLQSELENPALNWNLITRDLKGLAPYEIDDVLALCRSKLDATGIHKEVHRGGEESLRALIEMAEAQIKESSRTSMWDHL